MDELDFSHDGIQHYNIRKFLQLPYDLLNMWKMEVCWRKVTSWYTKDGFIFMVLCKGGFIIMKKTPVIFTGHGSPMLAIDENDLTREMQRVGADVLTSEDKPKAILAISAHWDVPGTYIQSAKEPRQIYDMCGLPEEL